MPLPFVFAGKASYKVTAQATLMFSDWIIPTCGITKFPSAAALNSFGNSILFIPKTKSHLLG